MNNKPVAWAMKDKDGNFYDCVSPEEHDRYEGSYTIPLYTQQALEEARKLGMQQERALWNLAESTQEIMNEPVAWMNTRTEDDRPFLDWEEAKNGLYQAIPLYTHPVKKLTDEEILESIKKSDFPLAELSESAVRGMTNFAKAILRKAQEK